MILRFIIIGTLLSCQQTHSDMPLYNWHFDLFVYACASLYVFLWEHVLCNTDWGSTAIYCLFWFVSTTRSNVFWPVSNSVVWPTQTIKDMPTVILVSFFHYGSATAGALITCVGLLREWMGTDSTTGPKQEPQGFRWAGFSDSALAGNLTSSISVCLLSLVLIC